MSASLKAEKQGIRVLLVLANSFMDNLIPLGVSLLSACLKKAGHDVRLFDTTFYKTRELTGDDARVETLQVKYTNFSELGIFPKSSSMITDFKRIVDEYEPDLIGVSVVESTYLIGIELLNSIIELDIPKVMGGVHVTFSPEEVIKELAVDMICLGEGEKAIVKLADRIRDEKDYSNISNLWVKRNGIVNKNPIGPLADLNNLPEQDWEIYEKERFFKPMGGKIYIAGTFEMNRGCPYDCAFCCNKGLQDIYKKHGCYYREKKIKILMNEIRKKVSVYNLQYLYIVAENFLLQHEERFDDFVREYEAIRLPFWIETRPDSIKESRLLKLRSIGCEGVSIGVEHGNDDFRKNILNRNVSNDVIIEAFRIAKKARVRACVNNIVGFPTETRELIFDTIELNRKINADNIIVNIFTPYRGTKLRQLAVEKGYLPDSAIAGDYRLDAGIRMPHLSPDAIRGLHRTFAMYVKFPKSMWPEIKKCEIFDDEGNSTFHDLREKYLKEYM